MRANAGPHPLVLLIFGAFILWGFGFETLGRRLMLSIDGVIVSSQEITSTTRPYHATRYMIRGVDGREQIYTTGATDATLPRSMPVGTQLRKEQRELSFMRNGERVNDFPLAFYSTVFGIALGCVVWSFLQWHATRMD
jgi:hypothetical protein